MDKVTPEQWRSFLIVAAALIVVANSIMAGIKSFRDLRKPSNDIEKWRRDTDTKLDNDNKRLIALESGNKALCQGMLAVLNHEITGDSIGDLTAAQKKMQDYLINR